MSRDHRDADPTVFGQLTLSAASCPLQTYWLTQARTTIGRRASNMLVLDDLTVSGEHALLIVGQSDAIIQDLGSRNGTLLNGAPIARALLQDGDCIDIGVYRLVFQRTPTVGGQGLSLPNRGVSRFGKAGALSAAEPEQPGQGAAAAAGLPDAPRPDELGGMLQAAGFMPLPAMPPLPGALPSGALPGNGDAGEGAAAASDSAGAETRGARAAADVLRPGKGGLGLAPGSDRAAGPDAGGGSSAGESGFPRLLDGSKDLLGFVPGFVRAPRLPPSPLPAPSASLPPRQRPPLQVPENYRGVSLRFLGGHDAGRLLLIDRPIVSIRNGSGQVAVVSCRPTGFYLTHVEGQAYPLVNGESIGLAAHPLRHNDLIELSGTIIQFCRHPGGPEAGSSGEALPGSG